MNIDKRLLRQVLGYLPPFIYALVSGVLGGGLIILQARMLSRIIADVFIDRSDFTSLRPLIGWLLFIVILRTVTFFFQSYFSKILAIKVKSRIRQNLFQKVIHSSPTKLREEKTGETSTLAMQGIESMDAYFSQYLPQLILAVIIPLAMLITVFPADFLTGIILLFTAPLIPIFMFLIGKSAEQLTKMQWLTLRRMGQYFLDTIQGLSTLKINNHQNEGEKIKSASEKYRIVTLKVLRITFLSAFVLEIIATISTALVAVQIGLRLLNGLIPFQLALFLLVIAPDFYLPLRTLGLRFHAGMTAMTVSSQLFAILDQNDSGLTFAGNILQKVVGNFSEPIHFRSVSITYPDRKNPSLQEATFSIHPGKVTALLGASGAGKSTIFNLLLRFIEPDTGDLTYGSQSIQDIPPDIWRKWISWVPQTPFLFQASIAENIQMAETGFIDQIHLAAQQARLHEFITSLPDGYQTRIGERGFRLSGGQIQRLALARAFYRNAPLLLLDEPVSYIDPQNAIEIQNAIETLCQTRTVLMISHHNSILQLADHAILLDRGSVISAGNPKTVVEGGSFPHLWQGYSQL